MAGLTLRVLLIARHYPPSVSGGARRPYLLAREMSRQGAEIFVAAPALPEGEAGVVVPHPQPVPTTGGPRTRTLRDHAREWLLWPDPDVRWAQRAARTGADAFVRAHGSAPDFVVTTSPPESIHAAGVILKRRWPTLLWVADFRDHWLESPHRQERLRPLRRAAERMIARSWLKRADLVTTVDRFIAKEAAELGAASPLVLPHFAPPEEWYRRSAPPTLASGQTHVLHAGSIHLSDRLANIDDLLKPFAAARMSRPDLHLHMVGRLTDEEAGLASAAPGVTVHGVLPFEETLAFERAADALAYVASSKANVPPSKITEYLAAKKPIIACGPPGVWRYDDRVDNVDPAAHLLALRKASSLPAPQAPPSATQVAERLLSAMRALRPERS
jgi:glycosyltransferase involved in cell wall biosynthesis